MNSEKLFVYGTLQPGGPFHEAIAGHVRGHCRAWIVGELVNVGRYPALLEGDGRVQGVLLEVAPEALAITDRIEGAVATRENCEYLRIRVEVFAESVAGLEARGKSDGGRGEIPGDRQGGAGARSGEDVEKSVDAWTYLYAHPSRLAGRPRLRVGQKGGRPVYAWPVTSSTLDAGSWRDRLRSMS